MQHGKIQSSQAVTTFGIGSICDLSVKGGVNSGIIAGLDDWPTKPENEIYEPSLAKALGVNKLYAPPEGEDLKSVDCLPAYRFPRRLFCNKCQRIGFPGAHFVANKGAIPKCKKNNCGGIGVPPRLVVVCFDYDNDGLVRGCIDDFPWEWWLFEREKRCDSPELFMVQSKKTFTLAGLKIECRCGSCNDKSRSLEGVFGERALIGRRCRGKRPWLNDEIDCGRHVRALLRGASNVYFPVNFSTISIPPYSDALVRAVYQCKMVIEMPGVALEQKIESIRRNVPEVEQYNDPEIADAIDIITGNKVKTPAPVNSQEQRNKERNALYNGHLGDGKSSSNSDFIAKPATDFEMESSPLLSSYVSKLVHVSRLREVKALRGFLRLENPWGNDPLSQACEKISKAEKDWLPAIETRGEGFYLEFQRERLTGWLRQDLVQERFSLIKNNITKSQEERGQPSPAQDELPSLEFLLIHSFSHLIIRQISLQCGYSSSSIRERIYVNNPGDSAGGHCGVLIYTATADADGTLGGLVRQSKPRMLESIIHGAIDEARFCSSDPLCIESPGQGADSSNLAACHSCMLLPETSCENNNKLLDRALIVGTLNNPRIGFFDGLRF